MTNWLSTLSTRTTRALGSGVDADMLRMAHELMVMEQGEIVSRPVRRDRRESVLARRSERHDRNRSLALYPQRTERMADRLRADLSTR